MLLAHLFRAIRGFRNRYRPERHYMRGPGPACARKRLAEESARSPAGQLAGAAHVHVI